MTRLGFRMAVVSVAALTWGCASTSGARSETSPTTAAPAAAHEHGTGSQSMQRMGGMCPMQLQDTTVTSVDVAGGVALDFKTSTGDVAELRQRVRRMAEMRQHHGSMMGGHNSGGAGAEHEHGSGAQVGPGGRHGGGMMMPTATASVEDIDAGARLVLSPQDPAQLQALREHARMLAGRMASGDCPMMPGSGGAMPRPPTTDGADHGAHDPPGE